MSNVRSFTVLPALPEKLKDLDFIARNMYWSWNPEFVDVFRRIDNRLWESSGHNPVKLLGNVSQETLEELSENKGFLSELKRAADKLREYLEAPNWYESVSPKCTKPVIAYFSAEFGLHESVPIYSGGLGILAGDHLKSASDLGVPLYGVGLMYQKGYFRQYLNIDGWQQEVFAENDMYNMPMDLIKNKKGEPIKISVQFPGRKVNAQIWRIKVGRVDLYLLDTNIPENSNEDRSLTANLYGGDVEMRIKQEILLGIGGLRALNALDIYPTVCHMNEGHAAFMALERIRQLREQKQMTFDEALEATKAGNVFTVHTPVKAGNDEFSVELMQKYFDHYYPSLGLKKEEFLALGRFNSSNTTETFKMPVLALRLSSCRNGVSKLHGEVSRKMWSQIWPKVPINEIPIGSVTNGVHIQTWLSDEMNALYDRYLGLSWAEEVTEEETWENIDLIPDEELWRTHQRSKGHLISFARNRLKKQIQRRGTYHTEMNWAEEVLDPEALTIGFARRFATYKRGNLIFKDPQRLLKIITDQDKPVQLIFAGKAHPRDTQGKEIIRSIIHFANQYDVRRRIVFLEDYDINVGRKLVQGVDIWLNNPRPPMEASGTSGMKAALNGALNFSTYDGWWCEGYRMNGGWVIGNGEQYEDVGYQDIVESQMIYNMLENEIVPLYYSRSDDNLPRAWIHRMKNTIKWNSPMFNTRRMVSEYTEQFYNPAAEKWRYLTAEAMARVKALSMWKNNIRKAWPKFQIKDVNVNVKNGDGVENFDSLGTQLKVGSQLDVRARVRLGDVDPEDISVEMYYGKLDSWGNIENGNTRQMNYVEAAENNGEFWFEGLMTCRTSGRQGVLVRVLPNHHDLTNPHELGLILWEGSNN